MFQATLSLVALGGKVFLLCALIGACVDISTGGMSMGGGTGVGIIVGAAIGGTIALAGVAILVGALAVGIYSCVKDFDEPDQKEKPGAKPNLSHKSVHASMKAASQNHTRYTASKENNHGREKEYIHEEQRSEKTRGSSRSAQAAPHDSRVEFSVKREQAAPKAKTRGFWDKLAFWKRNPEPTYQEAFIAAMDYNGPTHLLDREIPRGGDRVMGFTHRK